MESWISKSDFLVGLQCSLALWYRKHRPELATPPDRSQVARFAAGDFVDTLARDAYPGGVLAEGDGIRDVATETTALLSSGVRRIFQAALVHSWGGCMADIFDFDELGSTIREVKSTAMAKELHIHDLAFQTLVFERGGFPIGRAVVVHLDPSAASHAPQHLFRETDVTDRVRSVLDDVESSCSALQKVVESDEPRVAPGKHCFVPYPCPFQSHCWRSLPPDPVHAIPRATPKQIERLTAKGLVSVRDISDDARLPGRVGEYVRRRRGGATVSSEVAAAWSASLLFPLHFVSFLNARSPVPRLEGLRPFEPLPYGVSVTTLSEDGGVCEQFHLARNIEDPRLEVADALRESVQSNGNIVVISGDEARASLGTLRKAQDVATSRYPRLDARIRDLGAVVEGAVEFAAPLPYSGLTAWAWGILGYDESRVLDLDGDATAWIELLHMAERGGEAYKPAVNLQRLAQSRSSALMFLHRWLAERGSPIRNE